MKLLRLTLLVYVLPLFSMEQEKSLLCDDSIFIIQEMLFVQNQRLLFCSSDNACFSANHAEFHEPTAHKPQLTSTQLVRSAHQRQQFLYERFFNECVVKLPRDQEVSFFDGPNDTDVIAMDFGWCRLGLKPKGNQELALDGVQKKKKKRFCWCSDCTLHSCQIKPNFVHYPIFAERTHITATAIHKKNNRIAVAYTAKQENKVLFLDLNENDVMKIVAKLEMPLNGVMGAFKKISFLTNTTALALTSENLLVLIALHNDGEITLHTQSIVDSKKNKILVRDFAIDHYNPKQMLMLLDGNKLVYGDWNNCSYTPLLYNIDTDILKFYKDTVAYRIRGEDQLTLFDLLLVKRYMFSKLIEHF